MSKTVEFFGGPMDGEIRTIPRGMKVFRVYKTVLPPEMSDGSTLDIKLKEYAYYRAKTFNGRLVMVYSGTD